MASSKPKPAFFIVAALVVAALVWFALSQLNSGNSGGPGGGGGGKFTDEEMANMRKVEAPDATGVTTVKEYDFVPSAKLPDVKGVSSYEKLTDRTVKFAVNVWAGWGPIIYANGGNKPGKTWTTPGGEPFKVELVLIDDPVAMRDAYAAGNVHIGWATLDMMPLFMEALRKDSRVMPRIYQQVDWSAGGDGIVVRNSIKSIADLRGKKVVLAQNSPSHFFLLNTLIAGGVQPSEVEYTFTKDAFQAAAAFNADKSIAACVSWAPDIYNLSDLPGNRMLVTTADANRLIADVWFSRADFAKDHPDIIEGLVRGIFDAMIELGDAQDGDAAKKKVAKLMSAFYTIPEADCLGMLGDAHSTNFAENREFFLNQNNPTNFEQTWNTAYFLYKRIRAVTEKTSFDEVMDFSVLKKLGKEVKYGSQRVKYGREFVKKSASEIQLESTEILTKTIVIHFFPNSADLSKTVIRTVDGVEKEELYDPNIDVVITEAGKLAAQYGAARIVIEGHTDSSMKSKGVPKSLVEELSHRRAQAVMEAIKSKFKDLPANQFSATGVGWKKPADPTDPLNHAKNRRVEIKVYPAEAVNPK